jgi:2,4-dienoyl-CoA reductase-like NADH-dependent reductase (Old Yellow Enzyme family)
MKLFDSVKVRGMVLRNRILMAPMLTNLGYKSKRGRAYFAARAKGGIGAIVAYGIPPDLLINAQAWEQKDQRQSFIEGIRELTEEVHNLGAKIGIQLWHGNRFPAIIGGNFDRGEWVAPSARIEGNPPHSMVSVSARLREMTIQEIESLIQSYSRAAAQAKEAGFDFVEFHGAHSYLANQFFSPADNHRTDKYGGNLAGRMRFGIDCIQAIRGAVGEDYPIFYRFPAEEARPGGITLSESIEYAVELEKAGVDVLNVSIGTATDRRGTGYYITPPYDQPAGTYVHLAGAIKRRVNILVAAVGRINSPGLAESILTEGKADLITIGRQLIADPEWPNKVADGEVEDIRPCLSCCECAELATTGKESQCAVNPMAGKEF